MFSSRGERLTLASIEFNQVSEEDREEMVREFSDEEVRKAVWECEGSKSPGLDEVNFKFIKEFWKDIKEEFFRVMREFHSNGRIVKGANCSFLVLIPKKNNQSKISDYRPMSLIG